MNSKKEHVIVVDAYSTGAFYIDVLEKKGIPAVHVSSFAESGDASLVEIVKHYNETNKHRYVAMFDGSHDFDALVEGLQEYNLTAVMAGSEVGVNMAAQVADKFNLPGNELAYVEATRDKYLMHQALAKAGVRALKSWLGNDLNQLEQWVEENGLPVVLKPTKSAAADGVHICKNLGEVRQAFENLIGLETMFGDTVENVLVQEFAAGQEVVVNTVSCQGRHKISDLWKYGKFVVEGGRSVYDGGELVEDFGELTESVLSYAFSVLDALKIKHGPAHTEIMLTEDGPVLIESGARPMGASCPQELIKECLGVTQLEMSIQASLEPQKFLRHLDDPYKLRKHLYIKCLISSRAGKVDSVPAVSLLAELPSVRRGNFAACFENDRIERTLDLLSSFGSVFLCHEEREVLKNDHAIIRSLEEDGENLLVTLAPEDDVQIDREWFKHIPDELWLKSDEEAAADTLVIWPLLKHGPGLNILDCPCGTAGVSFGLAQKGARVTGLDLNPTFVEAARKRFAAADLPGEFFVKDMRELDVKSEFDVVLNWFNSIGYFDIETDFEILKRMVRALVPGGILILEAPNRANILANTRPKFDKEGREISKQWDELSERVYLPVTVEDEEGSKTIMSHVFLYSLAQLKSLFHLVGLEVEAVYNESLKPFTNDSKRMILVGKKTES